MTQSLETIAAQVETVVLELLEQCGWNKPKLLVIGTSTSEVMGKHIGSSGALEVAGAIYSGLERAREKFSFIPVFQCCEHLNRAIVMEQEVAETLGLTLVQAIPISTAGGSMATYAYRQLKQPCLVEGIAADAGIDIGDTLIGMHLKAVAVPVRATLKQIGEAHLTMAYTRPKLIGGQRAVYSLDENI